MLVLIENELGHGKFQNVRIFGMLPRLFLGSKPNFVVFLKIITANHRINSRSHINRKLLVHGPIHVLSGLTKGANLHVVMLNLVKITHIHT